MLEIFGLQRRNKILDRVSNAVTQESRSLSSVVSRMAMIEAEADMLMKRVSAKRLRLVSARKRKRRKS
jgi:hypothetical protein